jgi:hypothetical protein
MNPPFTAPVTRAGDDVLLLESPRERIPVLWPRTGDAGKLRHTIVVITGDGHIESIATFDGEISLGITQIGDRNHTLRLRSVIHQYEIVGDPHDSSPNSRRVGRLAPASSSARLWCALPGCFMGLFKFLENVAKRRVLCFWTLFLRTFRHGLVLYHFLISRLLVDDVY